MFAGGNVLYAVLGTLPRTDYQLRVWLMLVARFLVGSGTGQTLTRSGHEKDRFLFFDNLYFRLSEL